MRALDRAVLSGLVVAGLSATAAAQETPAQDDAAASESPELSLETVVVREVKPDASTRIDRQTYEVQHDPQVDTASALEILSKVPSVSVAANGNVLLLGRSSVSVMIDGREVSWNDQSLNLLPASQIDRIEVMTNPSAEFQAQSGGIINIITKRQQDAGFGGQVKLGADTFGSRQLEVSPSWAHGNLSVNGTFGYRKFLTPSRFFRTTTALDADPPVQTTRKTRFWDGGEPLSGRLQTSLKLDKRNTVTLTLDGYRGNHKSTSRVQVRSGPDAWFERVDSPSHGWSGGAKLSYERKGRIDGELLTFAASTQASGLGSHTSITDLFETLDEDPSVYAMASRFRFDKTGVTADYKRPVGTLGKLSAGASWNRTDEDDFQSSLSLGAGTQIPDYETRHRGGRDLSSLYTTFEFSLGDWTVLPGLRLEDEDLRVRGDAGVRQSRSDLFPSLHISRDFSEDTKLVLSATRRIDRPSIGRLDPAITFRNTTTASAGNPDLLPVRLTNYEARLSWKRDSRTITATLYDHESDLGWQQATQVMDDNVRLTTWTNVSGGWDRGGELTMAAPLTRRWQYTVTANVFEREGERLIDGVASRQTDLTYTGKAKLEYSRKNARGDLVDQGELLLRYYGPESLLQGKTTDYWRADLTWRRTLTAKTVLALTVSDLFRSGRRTTRTYDASFVDVARSEPTGPSGRVSLTYKFGNPE